MKRITLSLVVFSLLWLYPISAQEQAGIWQGTLHAPPQRDQRIVVKIDGTDASGWTALMYFIDQSGYGNPAAAVSFQDRLLRYSIVTLSGSFEGSLSGDGRSIAGTWKQGPIMAPLLLERATSETAWPIPAPPPLLALMAADAWPEYEVASIKPSDPNTQETPQHSSTAGSGYVFTSRNTSLTYLVTFAYGLQASQILGAPAWFSKTSFDIDAKMGGEGRPNDEQIKRALQKLIERRFKLTWHTGKKAMAHYEIVVSREGPRNLTKSNGFEGDPHNERHTLSGPVPGIRIVKNSTLQDLGNILGRFVLDKPVVNRTGIVDRLDFTLYWTPDEFEMGSQGVNLSSISDKPDAPPRLFTAIREQLGLELKLSKGPIEVMIVDHVERPSAN